MTYNVYWVHKPNHTDPYTDGYIGISKNVSVRLKQHQRTKNTILFNVFKNYEPIVDIIHTEIDLNEALQLEYNYRPAPKIGWNICEGGGKPPCGGGKDHHNYGRKHSPETLKKLSDRKKGPNHPNYGKHLSEDVRNKISLSQTGVKNHRYGKNNSEESNLARSLKLQNKIKEVVSCPHCLKQGGRPAMMRFHFNNCKWKGI